MPARAIWKGAIKLGNIQVPVKLYSAVQDRDVHFTLLDKKQHARVEQRMVKPDSDEAVEYEQIRKGYLSDGSYVMLERDELGQLAPKPSREIEVTRFVADDELGPEWFVRPYYLGPDGSQDSYVALQRALAEEEREGIAQWVMRGVEYRGVLRAQDGHLMLVTLRHPDEVIATDELPKPEGRAHNDKEAKMAEQLVLAFADDFDPAQYRNEHRDRLLALVEAKAKGKRPRLKPVQEKHAAPNLTDALRKSLLAAHGKSRAQEPLRTAKKRAPARRGARRKEQAVA
jgi:DNA end-binding protein Ku